MSISSTSTKVGTRVSFVVKHTFIEVRGCDREDTSPRRKSDIGPIRTARTLECISGHQMPSTCDDDDSEEEELNDFATRKVSFVSSVDSDDFIGAPLLSAAQTSEIDSSCHSTKTKAELPWAPCSSSDSTASTTSQTPWAPCWSSNSTLSSGSQLSSVPGLLVGSWCPSGNLLPSSPPAIDTLQQTCQNHTRMRPAQELPDVEEPCVVAAGESRTTLMVRKLPAKLCQLDFVKQLNQRGYKGLFDFVYMPMNLRENGHFGYAFVNFTSASVAVQFMMQLQSLEHDENEWRGIWSTCQGMEANVERYRNSPLMHSSVPTECKPALYDERGIQVQFPAPTKTIPKPRIHHTKGKAVQKDSEQTRRQIAKPARKKTDSCLPKKSASGLPNMVGHLGSR